MSDPERSFLGRDEFENFERNVVRSFDNVNNSINALSSKIEGYTSKGTNWGAIFSGFGVLISVIMGIGALVAWGLNDKLNSLDDFQKRTFSMSDEHTIEASAVNSAHGERLRWIERELSRIEILTSSKAERNQ